MFSDLSTTRTPITLESVLGRVAELPEGSRQRDMTQLWHDWLAHVRLCQLRGHEQITPGCSRFPEMSEFLAAFPWMCCSDHQRLTDERQALIERAQQVSSQPDGYGVVEVLSTKWWRFYSTTYAFDPHQRVVQGLGGILAGDMD